MAEGEAINYPVRGQVASEHFPSLFLSLWVFQSGKAMLFLAQQNPPAQGAALPSGSALPLEEKGRNLS